MRQVTSSHSYPVRARWLPSHADAGSADLVAAGPTVTIIAGRHDRVVPLVSAEFLDERLPASRLVTIDAGRFSWEEAPARYASAILDAIRGG
jgi:pimeloyl-ACP methyl ester carboxylesterase